MHICTGTSESGRAPGEDSDQLAQRVQFLHVDNETSDQTARMCRLISVFIGRTSQKVRCHVAAQN